MSKPRALDLFCCAGGVSMGLHRAGFEVVGVDIRPQPRYPFTFHQADALTFPLDGFDFLWASPVCDRWTPHAQQHGTCDNYPDLIAPMRERLKSSGAPYCMENVPRSPVVCLNQGINVRLIDDEAAEALASIEYRDSKFQERRIYTAWDNLKDERVFFRGVDRLTAAGIKADDIMAYMLVGYDPSETWERIFHRFDRMVERGILPYPMVYDPARKDLKAFQKFAVMGLYRTMSWEDFDDPRKTWRAA